MTIRTYRNVVGKLLVQINAISDGYSMLAPRTNSGWYQVPVVIKIGWMEMSFNNGSLWWYEVQSI